MRREADIRHARAIATVRYSVNNMHVCRPHLKSCVESLLLFPDYGYDTGAPTGRVLTMYVVLFRCQQTDLGQTFTSL